MQVETTPRRPPPQSFDGRVTCTGCANLWEKDDLHYCTNHRRAGLTTRELAIDLTRLSQRCPGYRPRA